MGTPIGPTRHTAPRPLAPLNGAPPHGPDAASPRPAWTADSWKARLHAQQIVYPDRAAVDRAVELLSTMPPLVTSWEIERLKAQIAEAQEGKRFLLQGGDCAERMSDCRAEVITAKLKILLQMSLVLVHASKRPVIRVGRFAGQYAKPRSSATETRTVGGRAVTLPSYYGDLVNGEAFTEDSRRPDPMRMVEGYKHAALTLNFVRSLLDGGFADLHHPEYWDLGFMRHAGLPEHMRAEYEEMTRRLADGLRFMEAIGERTVDQLSRVEFFTSHEGLNLLYESSLTRTVPRRDGHYNLGTHLPWIGERTRALDGAHVEYFRGIRNPVGIKVGPNVSPYELAALVERLNPDNEPGKIVVVARMGAPNVHAKLPALIDRLKQGAGGGSHGGPHRVLWVCDPMHGNTRTTPAGIKTRSFDDVLAELDAQWSIHQNLGSRLGGVHIELTGEDVTECTGGAAGLRDEDLTRRYESPCDPRLNYEQALELAFMLARRMGGR
ncbi:MAG: 3-deoxy-7-phosphoheptulonate synthase class II [Phycisphaerales bacterium]